MRKIGKLSLMGMVVILIIMSYAVAVTAEESLWYPSPKAEWAKVKELTIFNLGTMEYDPALTEVGLAFEALTGIHINFYEAPAATLLEDMSRSMALGESTYDVFDGTSNWGMPGFVNAGWIVPLNDVISPQMRAQWFPGLREACMMDGKVYFVPHQSWTYVWYYRSDLVKNTGVSLPLDSWDEFVDLAKKLTIDKDGDGIIDRYGFAYSASGAEMALDNWTTLVFAAGGNKMFNADGSPAFDTSQGVAGLQFMVDLVNKYGVTPPGVVDMREGDLKDLMGGDHIAMAQVDNSMYLAFKGLELYGPDIKIMKVVPRTAATDAHYIAGDVSYCVNKNSTKLEAAKQYAAFAGSYIANWLEACVELNTPALPSVFESPFFLQRFPEGKVISESLKKGVVVQHPNRSLVEDIVAKGVQAAIRKEKTAQEAIDWMVAEMKRQRAY